MSEFVPSGYTSIREAINQEGRELFPLEWSGEEHKARSGLISEGEWVETKDLSPARGADATGSDGLMLRKAVSAPIKATPHWTGDPLDPSYQAEYRAHKRYVAASREVRVQLEAGRLEAVLLNPWNGSLHPIPLARWRQHNADKIIAKGEALLPDSPNTGTLLIRSLSDSTELTKPLSPAKMREAINALKERIATERLTRPEQADFVRKNFPSYRVTERQLTEIFRAVPVLIGRPKKSDKKL